MDNLISPNLKLAALSAMKNIFDTYKRSDAIKFYKTESKTILMVDPDYNYNFGFSSQPQFNKKISNETTLESFRVRIWYLDEQTVEFGTQGRDDLDIKYKQFWGKIKIQMEQDAFDYFQGVERVLFLDEEYKINKDIRNIGILGEFQYYEIILERVN